MEFERGGLPSIQLQYKVVPLSESWASKLQGFGEARPHEFTCDWATTAYVPSMLPGSGLPEQARMTADKPAAAATGRLNGRIFRL